MPPCRTDELAAAHPVGIRGVDHRQPGGPQPVVDGVQQALEDHLVDVLVRLIFPQPGSQLIRRDDGFRREVPGGKRGLAGAGGANQDHQRGGRQLDPTAWLGGAHLVGASDRSTPASRFSAADFSLSPARASLTARRNDSMVASYVGRSTG